MKALLVAAAMAALLVPVVAFAGDPITEADERAWELEITNKTADQCTMSNANCETRMRTVYGEDGAPNAIEALCKPYLQPCLDNAKAFASGAAQTATAPMPESKVATVVKDVDLYDVPNGVGKVIGMLESELQVTLTDPCYDNWCHVEGESVPGGSGYVYSGPDYESLDY